MHDTPVARVGTVWSTQNIWPRKWFNLESVPMNAALLMHHDEDVEVDINRQKAVALKEWSTR